MSVALVHAASSTLVRSIHLPVTQPSTMTLNLDLRLDHGNVQRSAASPETNTTAVSPLDRPQPSPRRPLLWTTLPFAGPRVGVRCGDLVGKSGCARCRGCNTPIRRAAGVTG